MNMGKKEENNGWKNSNSNMENNEEKKIQKRRIRIGEGVTIRQLTKLIVNPLLL